MYYIVEICLEGRIYAVFLLSMVIINKVGINFGFNGPIYAIGCDILRYILISKLTHLDELKMYSCLFVNHNSVKQT